MYQVKVTKNVDTRSPETKVLMGFYTTEDEALMRAQRLQNGYDNIGIKASFEIVEADDPYSSGGENNE